MAALVVSETDRYLATPMSPAELKRLNETVPYPAWALVDNFATYEEAERAADELNALAGVDW